MDTPAKHWHLDRNEQAALQALVTRLLQRYNGHVLRVVLFGSKARGDADAESDLDVLIVVCVPEKSYWQHWRQIADMAWEVEFEYSVVMSIIIKTPIEYEQMQRDRLLLYRNIERDGVILWMRQPDALMYESV